MVFLFWLCSVAQAATLAILPFDNHTGNPDHDALGTGVSVMLMSDLGAVGSLQLVERSRLQDVIAELKLGQSDFVDPKRAAKAGKVVGADWILTGALVAVEPDLRIDARIVEVETGNILGTGTAEGPIRDFFDVEKDLALVVTDKLGLALSSREAAKVGRVATESFDAFRAWSEGLQAIDRGKVDEARKRFAAALRYDSGFSAANAAMDSIRASVGAAEAVREKVFDEDLAWLERYAADRAKGKEDPKALAAMLQRLQMQIFTRPPAVQRAVGQQLVDMQFDESAKMYEGPAAQTVNEYAIYLMVMSSNALKDREGVLSWGQTFVDRYPNGTMYVGVRGLLDQVLRIVDKENEARASGVVDRIEAEHRFEMYAKRCEYETVPAQRARECRAMLAAAPAAPEAKWNEVFSEAVEGAADAGDLQLARDALAAYRSRLDSPETIRRAEAKVDELKACLDSLDREKAEFEAEIAKKTRYWRRHLEAFRRCGAYERALPLAERVIDAKERAEQHWKLLVGLGRVAELKQIHASVMQQTDPFLAESSRRNDIERLEREAGFARGAEAARLWAVANALSNEGLNRDSAELFDELVADHLDVGWLPASTVVLRAASAWYSVFSADAPGRARAYYQRVIDEYPDSDDAKTAKTMIAYVP